MSNRVFVLDNTKQPLMPCHPARARELMKEGKAAVYRRFPFTIILREREGGEVGSVRMKIDPGSKFTGVAVMGESGESRKVLFAAEIEHRGHLVRSAMQSRANHRGRRRNRKTRYRMPRFRNRVRGRDWLPPSLESLVSNITSWVARIRALCPVTHLSLELVRFGDRDAEVRDGLAGITENCASTNSKVREYLLKKWDRSCAYCGKKEKRLQLEHIEPKSRGGTNRLSNLVVACRKCNTKKGSQFIESLTEFDKSRLLKIQTQRQSPMEDVASVNRTQWNLRRRLDNTGLPLECSSGEQTKCNRLNLGYPKVHWVDAACIGESGVSVVLDPSSSFLSIKAMGHGIRQICRTDRYGFPIRHCPRKKGVRGFQTGDIVRASVSTGIKSGVHFGRVAVRSSGRFDIRTSDGIVQGIGWQKCKFIHRNDGYGYQFSRAVKVYDADEGARA